MLLFYIVFLFIVSSFFFLLREYNEWCVTCDSTNLNTILFLIFLLCVAIWAANKIKIELSSELKCVPMTITFNYFFSLFWKHLRSLELNSFHLVIFILVHLHCISQFGVNKSISAVTNTGEKKAQQQVTRVKSWFLFFFNKAANSYGSCTQSANASFFTEANSTKVIIFPIETGEYLVIVTRE